MSPWAGDGPAEGCRAGAAPRQEWPACLVLQACRWGVPCARPRAAVACGWLSHGEWPTCKVQLAVLADLHKIAAIVGCYGEGVGGQACGQPERVGLWQGGLANGATFGRVWAGKPGEATMPCPQAGQPPWLLTNISFLHAIASRPPSSLRKPFQDQTEKRAPLTRRVEVEAVEAHGNQVVAAGGQGGDAAGMAIMRSPCRESCGHSLAGGTSGGQQAWATSWCG